MAKTNKTQRHAAGTAFRAKETGKVILGTERITREELNTRCQPIAEMTPPQYNKRIKGRKVDPYRILRLYAVSDPGQGHAIKKLLRAGKDHQSWVDDIREARDTLNRVLEMEFEDEEDAHEIGG